MSYYDEDGEFRFESEKFDDCYSCKNKFKERICKRCEVGEEFEENDPDDILSEFEGWR